MIGGVASHFHSTISCLFSKGFLFFLALSFFLAQSKFLSLPRGERDKKVLKRRQSSARSHSENWIEQREELKRETVEEQDEEQTETGKPTDDRFFGPD